MSSIINLIKGIKCSFSEHTPEPYLTETDSYIATKRCSRCKDPMFTSITWKINVPPPNSDTKAIKEYNKYLADKYQKLRNSINK